ncbi:MAG: TetR/AcrR family transcriptional regulator [Thermoleophilaceae bacterium]|nr:TetR/AcrR family transcriptional regulator [Thermoleophilaceae bacterium]
MLQEAIEQAGSPEPDPTTERILVGARQQFEEFGLRRTTMEDVARRVGVSRVTIYRRFPGKDALVGAVLLEEARRFFGELEVAVEGCEGVDEVLAEGFAFALERLRGHVLLNRLLDTEPESILPHLTLESQSVVESIRGLLASHLALRLEGARLTPADVEVAAEMLLRLVLSFLLTPHTVARVETPDEARRFARRYLSPALSSVAAENR